MRDPYAVEIRRGPGEAAVLVFALQFGAPAPYMRRVDRPARDRGRLTRLQVVLNPIKI